MKLDPVIGFQWRNWNGDYDYWLEENKRDGIDQLQEIEETIKNNPTSRRMILSSWNVEQINDMALPPCHLLSQFYVQDNKLSCSLYQRSCDMFLGVPFNIASYSALIAILAERAGLQRGEFVWFGGDVHIYKNHIAQCNEQLQRTPKNPPVLNIDSVVKNKTLDDINATDFSLQDYDYHPFIKAEMAV